MSNQQIHLTLTRRGDFTITSVGDDSTQCGLRGTRKLFYRVEVTCPDSELDANGFMVDQLDIHAIITSRYSSFGKMPSCERLAINCAGVVWGMVQQPSKVRVTIGSGPMAFMTAEMSAPATIERSTKRATIDAGAAGTPANEPKPAGETKSEAKARRARARRLAAKASAK